MKETIAKINEVVAALQADLAKAAEGNKAAAARARQLLSSRNSERLSVKSPSQNSNNFQPPRAVRKLSKNRG